MMSAAPVVLVTGGSRGIGAATCRLAADRGYAVAVNYKNDKAAADEVVKAITASGGSAVTIQGDMAVERDIARVFDTVDTSLGRLTHLVYNSGVTGKNSRMEAVDTQTIRDALDVNVLGALLCVRSAIPRISTRQGGQGGAIVLLSSVASTLGAAGEYVWYAASKGAVDSMTLGLAQELGRDGIRVNTVSPGAIDTDIHEPGRLARVAGQLPLGRAGRAEEVAEAILFLLSDASSYTTGTIMRVAGGR
jgi:NAD(P)-dependent dehydrogenase (short-subunit alcohol dehydrogenase family)